MRDRERDGVPFVGVAPLFECSETGAGAVGRESTGRGWKRGAAVSMGIDVSASKDSQL